MKKLLITGASGLLGLNLALEAHPHHEVLGVINQNPLPSAPFATRALDLQDRSASAALIDEFKPDWLIHCAALANLEACEQQPNLAQQLNAELPGQLAEICLQRNIRFLHISTDAVFDGEKGNYIESDPLNPLSQYAKTKLAGEQAVQSIDPNAIIARVNFFGWSLSGSHSLAEFFFNNLKKSKPMKGLIDRYFNPLHATHLSQTLLKMLDHELSGTYHLGSPFPLSKYEFGVAIADVFNLEESLIEAVISEEIGLKAARSPNLTMNVEKIARDLGQELPDVYKGIALLNKQHKDGLPKRLRALQKMPVN